MSQATTSQLVVSLRPPRPLPTTSFATPVTALCQSTTLPGFIGCPVTPICSVSPDTLTGTAITFDRSGIPYLLCTDSTFGLSATSSTSRVLTSETTEITTSESVEATTTSMQLAPSGTSTSNFPTTTMAPTTPAATGLNNSAAMHNASPHTLLPGFILLLWIGYIAVARGSR
jgi:hypothetical protein